jgi:hypothetical protein
LAEMSTGGADVTAHRDDMSANKGNSSGYPLGKHRHNVHIDNKIANIYMWPYSLACIMQCRRIVDIRIDITSEGLQTVVRISGRLSEATVAELEKACGPMNGATVLDLSNLVSADNAGVYAIRALVENGAEIRGASPFIQLLLDAPPGI